MLVKRSSYTRGESRKKAHASRGHQREQQNESYGPAYMQFQGFTDSLKPNLQSSLGLVALKVKRPDLTHLSSLLYWWGSENSVDGKLPAQGGSQPDFCITRPSVFLTKPPLPTHFSSTSFSHNTTSSTETDLETRGWDLSARKVPSHMQRNLEAWSSSAHLISVHFH